MCQCNYIQIHYINVSVTDGVKSQYRRQLKKRYKESALLYMYDELNILFFDNFSLISDLVGKIDRCL